MHYTRSETSLKCTLLQAAAAGHLAGCDQAIAGSDLSPTSAPTTLTRKPASVRRPAWAYVTNRDGNDDVYIARPPGE